MNTPAISLRTGILHVPSVDADAAKAVLAVMRDAGVHALVIQESSAKSQRNWIADILCRWCDEEELDLVLTMGGTLPAPGPSGCEIVPEAMGEVLERELPGLAEAMRAYAAEENDLAFLERGRAGIRGRTLILNLPAGADPAVLFMEAIAHLVAPVLAHLRDEMEAASVAAAFAGRESQPGDDVADNEDVDTGGGHESPTQSPTHGLDASEFAAFLKRSNKENAGDE
jgi:molybdopterin adenylyltransferase